MEDKYMIVTDIVTKWVNVRSEPAKGAASDLGDFNLLKGDIIHAVEVRTTETIYHRFDELWRNGVLVAFPASPTSEYWSAERSTPGSSETWLADTSFTPPTPPPTAKQFIATVVIEDDDGARYGWENQEMPKL